MSRSSGQLARRLIVVAHLHHATKRTIADWVRSLDWPTGTELKRPHRYHITLLFSPIGGDHEPTRQWAKSHEAERFRVRTGPLDVFTDADGVLTGPTILRLESPQLLAFVDHLHQKAIRRGLVPSRFGEAFSAHSTWPPTANPKSMLTIEQAARETKDSTVLRRDRRSPSALFTFSLSFSFIP